MRASCHLHGRYNVLRLVLCSCIRCRRTIPPPAQLEHELNKLMNRVWVDHAGVNLLTDKTFDVHESALKLVRKGAVSGELCGSGKIEAHTSNAQQAACMLLSHASLALDTKPSMVNLQIPCQSHRCTSRPPMEPTRR